jgi:CrcB protein
MERTRASIQATGIAAVAVGGFAGAATRHTVALDGPDGAAATLVVNVFGSLALGFVLSTAWFTERCSRTTRLALATGFLSSLTTYSTFAAETTTLAPTLAVGNVAATYGLGMLAVVGGQLLGRKLP